ncbi:hypothetical protein [Pseudomonas sp. 44 R 15]|uniref:hypothetical protein n=1 Tax=Pseudomonas sp. 44 R 15 TaxID=1844105 RepID=UPI00081273A7|nr:hypothetical protein [Pseudomonas sp. 44 R 15]CRM31935.1 Site-specific recombinase XerD [Pseudomonas sp. 44 R 15]
MSLPNPLFSGITSISLSELAYYGEHPGVERYLAKFDSNLNAFKFANIAREFIASRVGAHSDGENLSGFGSSRSITERLLLWSWIVKGKSVEAIEKEEFREFLEFNSCPPSEWVGDVARRRFDWVDGVGYIANPAWRPFSKPANETGMRTMNMFKLIVSCCTSFYDHLIRKGICQFNPAQNVEWLPLQTFSAEARSIDRGLTIWHVDQILRVGANLDCGRHERALFIVALMRYLLVPIRWIAKDVRRTPSFNLLKHTTCGFQYLVEGLRGVEAVTAPNIFIPYLQRYRSSRGLPREAPDDEDEPLLVTSHGRPGLTQRQIRNLVYEIILVTVHQLEIEGADNQEIIPLKSSCLDSIRIASISGSLREYGIYETQKKLGSEIFSSILRKGI